MSDLSPYVPADALPRLLDGWIGPYEWSVRGVAGAVWWPADPYDSDPGDCQYRLDTRRWEVRSLLARRIAEVLGAKVGSTGPLFLYVTYVRGEDASWLLSSQVPGSGPAPVFRAGERSPYANGKRAFLLPALADIPIDHPDRDALALAAVVRWLGAEIKAGRIVPAEVNRG